jgi:hypothetical protein
VSVSFVTAARHNNEMGFSRAGERAPSLWVSGVVRLRYRGLVVLLLALVLTLAAGASRAFASPLLPHLLPPSPAPCASTVIIGARGSGQSFNGFDGMGPAVDYMAHAVGDWLAKEPDGVQYVGDPYPADSTSVLAPSHRELFLLVFNPNDGLKDYLVNNVAKFESSIDVGIVDAVALADETIEECPATKLVMAGYSQGAMVIHQTELHL